MSQIADKQLAEVKADAAIYPGVLTWIAKFTGGRAISEWISDGKVEIKERVMVARNLVDLLLATG